MVFDIQKYNSNPSELERIYTSPTGIKTKNIVKKKLIMSWLYLYEGYNSLHNILMYKFNDRIPRFMSEIAFRIYRYAGEINNDLFTCTSILQAHL